MLRLILVIAAILASAPLAYVIVAYAFPVWPVGTAVLSTGALITLVFASALYETKRDDK